MGGAGQGATLLCMRSARPLGRTPHQTGQALHLRGTLQVLPSRLKHGLAWEQTSVDNCQNGRA